MFVTPDYSSADPRSNSMGGQYSYDTSSNASIQDTRREAVKWLLFNAKCSQAVMEQLSKL